MRQSPPSPPPVTDSPRLHVGGEEITPITPSPPSRHRLTAPVRRRRGNHPNHPITPLPSPTHRACPSEMRQSPHHPLPSPTHPVCPSEARQSPHPVTGSPRLPVGGEANITLTTPPETRHVCLARQDVDMKATSLWVSTALSLVKPRSRSCPYCLAWAVKYIFLV